MLGQYCSSSLDNWLERTFNVRERVLEIANDSLIVLKYRSLQSELFDEFFAGDLITWSQLALVSELALMKIKQL